MTFFHKLVGFFDSFFHELVCLCLAPLPAHASAHAGLVLVFVLSVFGRQLYTLKLIMTGQHLVYEAFPFRKSTSITLVMII